MRWQIILNNVSNKRLKFVAKKIKNCVLANSRELVKTGMCEIRQISSKKERIYFLNFLLCGVCVCVCGLNFRSRIVLH